MKKLIGILAVASAFAFVVSCGSKKEVALTDGQWKLTSIDLNDAVMKVEDKNPTIEFSDTTNRVSGFAGCNRFFGTYAVAADGKLELSQMASTMMMCPDMELEDKFMHLLANVKSFRIKGEELVLLDSADVQKAVFTLVKEEVQ